MESASPGPVDFTITEGNTTGIDGEIPAVIGDDRVQTMDKSVVLPFGGQNTSGDNFTIGLMPVQDIP